MPGHLRRNRTGVLLERPTQAQRLQPVEIGYLSPEGIRIQGLGLYVLFGDVIRSE